MKIKTKLTLGVGLLFLLILLLSAVSAKYMFVLQGDIENVLENNYRTLEFSRNMLHALEDGSAEALSDFEANLLEQDRNVTEIGEREMTTELRGHFENYRSDTSDERIRSEIRKDIFQLMEMNMQAIQRKSELAKRTAYNAILWIAIVGVLCFSIAFVLLVNLPSNIADPIRELTRSIRQIAAKNYSERVHFEGHNEFGQLATSFNAMAEKLQEYSNSSLAKLMIEKKRIETLIDKMHDPVIGLDENMRVIFANEEANSILGLPDPELIGLHSKDVALKNDLLRQLIQDLNEDAAASTKPMKIYAHGKEGYFEREIQHITVVPTGETVSKVIGHVIILRDVTRYKELDFAKTNFLATVSHEFKTPIASIKMSVQLLEGGKVGKLNGEQKELLIGIGDDADRLLKITKELLNLTQLDSGNIQLAILPSDPMEILHYAIDATHSLAEQKQVKLEVHCPERIPKVQADTEKTAWVVTNLISNAIRYSYDNSTVYVTVKETSGHVEISVRDTGQGIAPQYKDKIFDRYFRVPGTKKEGTGLGLAISKEFIEAQGGQITVDSEFGAGSTFSLTLNKTT